jgi:hypothetical protein
MPSGPRAVGGPGRARPSPDRRVGCERRDVWATTTKRDLLRKFARDPVIKFLEIMAPIVGQSVYSMIADPSRDRLFRDIPDAVPYEIEKDCDADAPFPEVDEDDGLAQRRSTPATDDTTRPKEGSVPLGRSPASIDAEDAVILESANKRLRGDTTDRLRDGLDATNPFLVDDDGSNDPNRPRVPRSREELEPAVILDLLDGAIVGTMENVSDAISTSMNLTGQRPDYNAFIYSIASRARFGRMCGHFHAHAALNTGVLHVTNMQKMAEYHLKSFNSNAMAFVKQMRYDPSANRFVEKNAPSSAYVTSLPSSATRDRMARISGRVAHGR